MSNVYVFLNVTISISETVTLNLCSTSTGVRSSCSLNNNKKAAPAAPTHEFKQEIHLLPAATAIGKKWPF